MGERRIELETCVLVIPDGVDITRLFLSADKILREAGVVVGEVAPVADLPIVPGRKASSLPVGKTD